MLPTPGTEAWWRAAVREAVYAPLEGPAQYVRETVNWTGLLEKGLGGLQLLQRLNPPLPPLSNLKLSHLHVSRYLLNCLLSIGDGKMVVECGGKHLEGFMHYAELADAIEKWLEETSRRRGRTSRT